MRNINSIRKTAQFQKVYRQGKSYANKYLVMYVLENSADEIRLGISVSKKVGNSVVRHRITRLIRESYRLHKELFSSGLDIVVIARASAKDRSFQEIESAFLHLGRMHGICEKW
ncbi:MAG: ribonuclease P protein component [Lachnospiraceae bacterium]|nr:ribonuclease P protein component [Lachnospiraceae bacterium]MCI8825051.1 ribonuclease P protein component [Lachnospiraceae bacterium]MCI9369716.1 ribonuclease P protein component [Lachnospiraceae bacterium]MDE7309305.1 ribonuclease P protein component [Lachnospiraceae bacterium]